MAGCVAGQSGLNWSGLASLIYGLVARGLGPGLGQARPSAAAAAAAAVGPVSQRQEDGSRGPRVQVSNGGSQGRAHARAHARYTVFTSSQTIGKTVMSHYTLQGLLWVLIVFNHLFKSFSVNGNHTYVNSSPKNSLERDYKHKVQYP